MEWETEKLSGWVDFRKLDGESICNLRRFEIPASEAVGKYAKYNILSAAGVWPSANIRCVRHFVSHSILLARVITSEHFVFHWQDIAEIKCEIGLRPSSARAQELKSTCGDDLQSALDAMQQNRNDALFLGSRIYSPAQIIEAADRVTELHRLRLESCDDATFSAIGRLRELRGLELENPTKIHVEKIKKNGKQIERFVEDEKQNVVIFDAAAAGELRKLEHLEVLSLRNGITVTNDAFQEIGALKNLKALHLNLADHQFRDRNACAAALAFLKELDQLEYAEIVTPFARSRARLRPRDLELPPSLKYLQLDGRVHRPNAARPLIALAKKDGALVCRFKGKETFRIAGDGTTPESRRQLVAALREMLIHLPPEDGAKIVKHGIAVAFDAPALAQSLQEELMLQVVSEMEKKG